MPHVPPLPQSLFVERDITNAQMRAALINLTKLMRHQAHVVNNYIIYKVNHGVELQSNDSTHASRKLDFMRINPSTIHGTKVDEDPKCFIDDFLKVVDGMGVTHREKAQLAAYQLKDVATVSFEQCSNGIPL